MSYLSHGDSISWIYNLVRFGAIWISNQTSGDARRFLRYILSAMFFLSFASLSSLTQKIPGDSNGSKIAAQSEARQLWTKLHVWNIYLPLAKKNWFACRFAYSSPMGRPNWFLGTSSNLGTRFLVYFIIRWVYFFGSATDGPPNIPKPWKLRTARFATKGLAAKIWGWKLNSTFLGGFWWELNAPKQNIIGKQTWRNLLKSLMNAY